MEKKSMSFEEWVDLGNAFKEFKAARIKVLEKCRKLPKKVYCDKDWWLSKRMYALCEALETRFIEEQPDAWKVSHFYGPSEKENQRKKKEAKIVKPNPALTNRSLLSCKGIDKMNKYEREISHEHSRIAPDHKKIKRIDEKRKALIEKVGKEEWEKLYGRDYFPNCEYKVVVPEGGFKRAVFGTKKPELKQTN